MGLLFFMKSLNEDKQLIQHLWADPVFRNYIEGLVGVVQVVKINRDKNEIRFFGALSEITAPLDLILSEYVKGHTIH